MKRRIFLAQGQETVGWFALSEEGGGNNHLVGVLKVKAWQCTDEAVKISAVVSPGQGLNDEQISF